MDTRGNLEESDAPQAWELICKGMTQSEWPLAMAPVVMKSMDLIAKLAGVDQPFGVTHTPPNGNTPDVVVKEVVDGEPQT